MSIVFSLSWPAFIRCVDGKQWSRAVLVLIALIVTGSYSISAALGSAMGGRANAAIAELDKADRRLKAQVSWDTAKSELDTLADTKPTTDLQTLVDNAKAELAKLPAARPVAELEALIRGAATHPNRGAGCTAVNGSLHMSCPKLEAERARAAHRERLTANISTWTSEIARTDQRRVEQREKAKAAMDNAAAELTKAGPSKVANSDAVALATYLQGLGIGVDADRVNKLLVLVAVLVIECGAGLSLAVGLSLSSVVDTKVSARTEGDRTPADSAAGHNALAAHTTEIAAVSRCPPSLGATRCSLRTVIGNSQSVSGVQLLGFIRDSGGVVSGGQRAMARALGWSKSRLHEVLHELASTGAVNLRTDKAGTIVRLTT